MGTDHASLLSAFRALVTSQVAAGETMTSIAIAAGIGRPALYRWVSDDPPSVPVDLLERAIARLGGARVRIRRCRARGGST